MGARHRGREIALQILYQVDVTGHAPEASIKMFKQNFDVKKDSWDFAEGLAKGICDHKADIDALIEKQSEHWKLSRMTVTDRNILRLAVFELKYRQDIPSKVTLNEAIELGKRYGTEDSGAFVNGVLDRIYRDWYSDKDGKTDTAGES